MPVRPGMKPNKKGNNVKKSILLLALFSVILVGCGQKKENTEDETLAAVYDVKEGANNYMVQLYNINAFNKSPLEEGVNMNEEELAARMAETNHNFIEQSVVTINDQEWKAGRQIMNDQKMARLTFYRMESTGEYDDSVVVGSIYYSLDPGLDKDRTALKKAIGQLKDVVYSLSKK